MSGQTGPCAQCGNNAPLTLDPNDGNYYCSPCWTAYQAEMQAAQAAAAPAVQQAAPAPQQAAPAPALEEKKDEMKELEKGLRGTFISREQRVAEMIEGLPPVPHHLRPQKGGQVGRKFKMDSNFFMMGFTDGTVRHYDVKTNPEIKNKEYRRKLIGSVCQMLKKYMPVYDGVANLYTFNVEIPSPTRITVKDPEAETRPGRPPKEFEVVLTLANTIPLAPLVAYVEGRSREVPRTQLQAIDVATRMWPSIEFFALGRAFFYPNDPSLMSALGEGSICWKGHFQAVRPTQMGLMMNVDVAAVAMIEPVPVLRYLVTRLGLNHPNDMRPNHASTITRLLKGLRIETNHPPGKRTFRVNGLSNVPCHSDKFSTKDGTESNVAEYFSKDKNIPLKFPNLPALKVGPPSKPISMPIELCTIKAGQRTKGKLSGAQTTKMLDATCSGPGERFATIKTGVTPPGSDPYMTAFGLTNSDQSVVVNARLLPPPALAYKAENADRQQTVQPQFGKWDLKGVAFMKAATVAVSHVFLVGINQRDQAEANQFVPKLLRSSQFKGLRFQGQPPIDAVQPDPNALAAAFQRACGGQRKPQIIICFLDSDKSPLYGVIKKLGDTQYGVVTQCLDMGKVRNPKKAGAIYQTNVAMKMNAKLGGINHYTADALPIVSKQPTLILGADVHHPPIGSRDISIAAVCGSYDRFGSLYKTVVKQQPSRQELIGDMKEAAVELIRNFQAKAGRAPERIIMLRDGVGESMFEQVTAFELNALQLAMEECKIKAKITYVIVQKRNHARFFPRGNDGDRQGNMHPGTVVDQDVVNRYDFDFFLCSHGGLKGTSKPCHYHVIVNEVDTDTADEVQQLIFSLCHVYARCTRSVSVPAPCYYAHLAAYRSRHYAAQIHDDDGGGSVRSGSSGPTVEKIENVHATLENVLWYA